MSSSVSVLSVLMNVQVDRHSQVLSVLDPSCANYTLFILHIKSLYPGYTHFHTIQTLKSSQFSLLDCVTTVTFAVVYVL